MPQFLFTQTCTSRHLRRKPFRHIALNPKVTLCSEGDTALRKGIWIPGINLPKETHMPPQSLFSARTSKVKEHSSMCGEGAGSLSLLGSSWWEASSGPGTVLLTVRVASPSELAWGQIVQSTGGDGASTAVCTPPDRHGLRHDQSCIEPLTSDCSNTCFPYRTLQQGW